MMFRTGCMILGFNRRLSPRSGTCRKPTSTRERLYAGGDASCDPTSLTPAGRPQVVLVETF